MKQMCPDVAHRRLAVTPAAFGRSVNYHGSSNESRLSCEERQQKQDVILRGAGRSRRSLILCEPLQKLWSQNEGLQFDSSILLSSANRDAACVLFGWFLLLLFLGRITFSVRKFRLPAERRWSFKATTDALRRCLFRSFTGICSQ